MKPRHALSILSAAMAIWCIVLAFVRFSAIWPYQLSKWAIFAGCIMIASDKLLKTWSKVLTGIIAVIFNPVIPFYLGRDNWQVMDIIAAVVLAAVAISEFSTPKSSQ